MVNVGDKPATLRRAVAECRVTISAALHRAIAQRRTPKGDVLETARLGGILAAKRVDELIPLCHTLPLDVVEVWATLRRGYVEIRAEARVSARTGVEMEALTAVAVAALTVIDMGKSIDPGMSIEGLRLIEKEGGRSGRYRASPSKRGRR